MQPESTFRAVVLIVLGGALLRLAGLGERQLWLDELIQLQRFRGPDLLDNVLALKNEIAAAPLDYLIQNAVVSLLGRSEITARLHAWLFGALALPLFFLIARRLFNRRIAVFSLVLLAVYPLHYHYSREGRNYALFFFLTLCSYLLLLHAMEAGRARQWAAFGAVTVLNLYTHYFGGLVLLSQAVFVASFASPRIEKRAPRIRFPRMHIGSGFGLAAGLALLVFLPWVWWTFDSARGAAPNALAESGLALRMFKEWTGGYPLSLLLGLCAALGLRRLFRQSRGGDLALLACWGMLPVLLVLGLVWWRHYIFSIRQLLFATPALLLVAAFGLEGLSVGGRHRALVRSGVLAGIVLLSLGTIFLHGNEEEADWKGLSAYLRENVTTERIAAPNVRFPLSFYLPDWDDRWLELENVQRQDFCESGLVLIEARYMTKMHEEAARALRQSAVAIKSRNFPGFKVVWLGC